MNLKKQKRASLISYNIIADKLIEQIQLESARIIDVKFIGNQT